MDARRQSRIDARRVELMRRLARLDQALALLRDQRRAAADRLVENRRLDTQLQHERLDVEEQLDTPESPEVPEGGIDGSVS